jgi:serine/threonine protein kinase
VKRAAVQGQPGVEYVVKCFNMYDSSKRQMLRDEVNLLIDMSSPTIVKFHGAFRDSSARISIVLEFMDRGSLHDAILFSRGFVMLV